MIHTSGVYYSSVFHTFTGILGPNSIAVAPSGKLYVARYDFQECSKNGVISVINGDTGVLEEELIV